MPPWLRVQVGSSGCHALVGHGGRLARLAGLKLLKQLFRLAHRLARPAQRASRPMYIEVRLCAAAADRSCSCALAVDDCLATICHGVRAASRTRAPRMRSRARPAGCLCELPASGEPDLAVFEPACACLGVRRAGDGCVIFGARPFAACRIVVPGSAEGLTSAIYGARHRFILRFLASYHASPYPWGLFSMRGSFFRM